MKIKIKNKNCKTGLRKNNYAFLVFMLLLVLLLIQTNIQTVRAAGQEGVAGQEEYLVEYLVINFLVSEKGQDYNIQIRSIKTQTRNAYYVLFEQEPDDPYYGDEAKNTVQLLDTSNEIIYQDILTLKWLAQYDNKIAKIRVLSESGEIILETPMSFCNGNGLCEPCSETGCVLAESTLTCNDCRTGTQDNFCDLKRDEICDPDCFGVDGDCSFCDERCYYEEMQNFSCAALGGKICGFREECAGGYLTYSEDSQHSCCIEGKCRNLGEYAETMSEMQNQPISTITPEGKTAADIYIYGIKEKYCTKTIGGKICSSEEKCDGEEIEYYYGAYCCKGNCEHRKATFAGARKMPADDTVILSAEEEKNLRATDSAEYGEKQFSSEAYIPLDSLKAIQDRDNLRYNTEKEAEREVRKEKIKETVSKITAYAPKTTGGIIAYAAGATGIAALFVIILVRFFRHSAVRETEEQKIDDNERKQIRGQDLQPIINSIISKGFTYEQAKKYLLEKGYDQQQINEEIVRSYNFRRQK
jgi:hypothetical protein